MPIKRREALEMMSCRRCGRYSGPELLCSDCDRETYERPAAAAWRRVHEPEGPYPAGIDPQWAGSD